MDFGLTVITIVGIVLMVVGGSITFSKKVLDWMYKQGPWVVAPPFNEVQDKRLRRFRSGALFLIGLILTVGTIYLQFFI